MGWLLVVDTCGRLTQVVDTGVGHGLVPAASVGEWAYLNRAASYYCYNIWRWWTFCTSIRIVVVSTVVRSLFSIRRKRLTVTSWRPTPLFFFTSIRCLDLNVAVEMLGRLPQSIVTWALIIPGTLLRRVATLKYWDQYWNRSLTQVKAVDAHVRIMDVDSIHYSWMLCEWCKLNWICGCIFYVIFTSTFFYMNELLENYSRWRQKQDILALSVSMTELSVHALVWTIMVLHGGVNIVHSNITRALSFYAPSPLYDYCHLDIMWRLVQPTSTFYWVNQGRCVLSCDGYQAVSTPGSGAYTRCE